MYSRLIRRRRRRRRRRRLRRRQVHEGDPREDGDQYLPGEECGPVACLIPIGFVLGRHEPRLRPGALAHLRFFPGAPGTPPGWLMGCAPPRLCAP